MSHKTIHKNITTAPSTWEVFISYSRTSSRKVANEIYELLSSKGIRTFIDDENIPLDHPFPEKLANAILDSKLFLLFADKDYFNKRWCILEFQAVLAPLRANPSFNLEHILVILLGEDPQAIIPHLPPSLAEFNLPEFNSSKILNLVQKRLSIISQTINDRLKGNNDFSIQSLRNGGNIPPAQSLRELPGLFDGMPRTLKNRFVGRNIELWSLLHESTSVSDEEAPRSCCVFGAPGTGKSQLVAEFVWRYGTQYFKGGVVWVNVTDDEEQLSKLFKQVGSVIISDTDKSLKDAVIQASQRGRVLWIIDGVPNPEPGKSDLPLNKWCPVREYVTLLCTAWRPRRLDIDVSIELRSLSEIEAISLLTQPPINPTSLDYNGWSTLASWVGSMPQALQILYAIMYWPPKRLD